jgi:hypothetical protein
MTEETKPPLNASQEKLTKFVTDVFDRLKFAQNLMGDSDFSPFKSKQFVGFIRDQLSEVTTRFVLVGEVDPPQRDPQSTGVDKREDEMKKKGFTVVGTAPTPEQKPETASPTHEPVDPNLASIPAFQLALSQGFDPTKPGPDE